MRMNMTNIINQMGVLFLLMALGFLAGKIKLLDERANKILSSLVMNITLPGLVLNSVLDGNVNLTGERAMKFILATLAAYGLMIVVAFFIPKLLRLSSGDAGVYKFITVFANVGFMGYPVTEAVFGQSSAIYVALLNVVFNLLAFTVGATYIRGSKGKINFKVFLSPTLIATAISILIIITKIRLPYVICQTASLLGALTTPVSMIVIGVSLSLLSFREVFGQWRMYLMMLLRLLILPIFLWLIFRNVLTDSLLLGILVVLMGMPVASMTTMMCFEYGGNTMRASQAVFITTLASFVTIPLLVYILQLC